MSTQQSRCFSGVRNGIFDETDNHVVFNSLVDDDNVITTGTRDKTVVFFD